MSFLRQLESLIGMFQRLPGILMAGHMVPFVMVRCGNTVCVSGEIVELRSALVRIVWHVLLLTGEFDFTPLRSLARRNQSLQFVPPDFYTILRRLNIGTLTMSTTNAKTTAPASVPPVASNGRGAIVSVREFAIERHLIEPTENILFTWAHWGRRG